MRYPTEKGHLKQSISAIFLSIAGLFLVCEPSSLAKLHFTELKGMQEHVQLNPGYEYLDPIGAFNLQRQGFLVNLVNYPEEVETFDKDGKPILIPDPISAFVKSVYNAPQNTDSPTFFQVSPLAKNFGRFLGPSAIGQILGKLSLSDADKEKFKKIANQDQLKKELKDLIEQDPEFQENKKKAEAEADGYQKQIDELEYPDRKIELTKLEGHQKELLERKKALKKSCSTCEGSPPGPNNLKLVQLNTELAEISSKLTDINKSLDSHRKETAQLLKPIQTTLEYQKLRQKRDASIYDSKYLNSFLDKLIGAWLAESSEAVLKGGVYPSHVIEKSLMSLAWMNTRDHDKSQFLKLYENMPHVLKGNHLGAGNWRHDQYIESDYQELTDHLVQEEDAKQRAQYLLNHREKAAFLSHAQMFFDKNRLPEIGYKSIHYNSKKLGHTVVFSDCMDSSVLNFLANVLKSPETGGFDSNWIHKILGAHGFNINPEFENFLKAQPNLSSLDDQVAHERWAPLVSDQEKVKYVQEGYEMDTQVINIFQIMDHLLFNPASSQVHALNHDLVTTNEQKMDLLCKFLSHEGGKLDWSIQGGKKKDLNNKETNIILEFTLNQSPYFNWNIFSGHSEIHPIKHENQRKELINSITSTIEAEKDATTREYQLQVLLGLVSQDDLPPLLKKLGQQPGFIRSLTLDSNEMKLRAMEGGLENHVKTSYSFLKKVDTTLPTAIDPQTKLRREVMLADADYPWGEPQSLIENPNLAYHRLTPEQREKLVAKHGKSFEKAWVTPRGLIVGDAIRDDHGNLAHMNWEKAKKKCEETGARLPTKEEWEEIGKDMGAESTAGYIPQFLPNLYNRNFWSSSPYDHYMAWDFHGFRGVPGVSPYNYDFNVSVRCVQSAAPKIP